MELTEDLEQIGNFLLRPDARVLGPRLGAEVQQVIRAAKAGDWTTNDDGTVEVAGHTLGPDEFELALVPHEGAVAAALPGNAVLVELDVEVTPELAAEGIARDVVRLIQQARKDAGSRSPTGSCATSRAPPRSPRLSTATATGWPKQCWPPNSTSPRASTTMPRPGSRSSRLGAGGAHLRQSRPETVPT
ncbi:MAG: DUF5915 domain-containing protein [Microthrixaceae bacterium]